MQRGWGLEDTDCSFLSDSSAFVFSEQDFICRAISVVISVCFYYYNGIPGSSFSIKGKKFIVAYGSGSPQLGAVLGHRLRLQHPEAEQVMMEWVWGRVSLLSPPP